MKGGDVNGKGQGYHKIIAWEPEVKVQSQESAVY